MGTGIKQRKEKKKVEAGKIMLPYTIVTIPEESTPGEEREIEKTPLCHPPLLQAVIKEGGREGGRGGQR